MKINNGRPSLNISGWLGKGDESVAFHIIEQLFASCAAKRADDNIDINGLRQRLRDI